MNNVVIFAKHYNELCFHFTDNSKAVNNMNTKFLFLAITVLCVIFTSCSKGDSEPYGAEYEIDGIELTTNSYYGNDTLSASQFVLNLNLKSDNEYAQDYGLQPRSTSKISDIKVFVLDEGLHSSISENDEVTQLFLMKKANTYDALYQTVNQYIEKGELESSQLALFFTNQLELKPRSEQLISDTISLNFRLELSLENSEVFSDQIKVTLIP